MATKKTAKKATKKAANTTKKAAEQTVEAASEFGSVARNRMIGLQQRSLEIQESAFDRTFDMVASAQERSEDRVNNWLDNSDRLPTEAKKIAKEWIGFQQDARKSYRDAVSSSFELTQKWFDGLKKSA